MSYSFLVQQIEVQASPITAIYVLFSQTIHISQAQWVVFFKMATTRFSFTHALLAMWYSYSSHWDVWSIFSEEAWTTWKGQVLEVLIDSLSWGDSQHQLPDLWGKVPWVTHGLLCWGLRYCESETNTVNCCTLTEFLSHWVIGYNKMILYTTKFQAIKTRISGVNHMPSLCVCVQPFCLPHAPIFLVWNGLMDVSQLVLLFYLCRKIDIFTEVSLWTFLSRL